MTGYEPVDDALPDGRIAYLGGGIGRLSTVALVDPLQAVVVTHGAELFVSHGDFVSFSGDGFFFDIKTSQNIATRQSGRSQV